ncbi:MAG TPA: carbon-nitrogen hydrolase family protein [Sedimentisphaerales bacterium]|nr:carbon-nitrogen hydrolase family protein [Sedimentisphaerales bacterium]
MSNGPTHTINRCNRRDFLTLSAAGGLAAALGGRGLVAYGAAPAREPAKARVGGASDKSRAVLVRRKATVSLVSFPTLPRNEPDRLNKTLENMSRHIAEAAALGSDLAAFPEIANTLGSAEPWQFEPLDGPTVSAISKAAKRHSIYVVCPMGTLEEGIHYNSSVLIGRDGRIVGVYHKNFPTHGELDIGIVPGAETPVFETDFGRVGLTICFDLNYWEVGSGLCANRAELVLWSSMWQGARMLSKWAIEFGFYMGAIWRGGSTFVDIAGREIISIKRDISDKSSSAPLVTATLDMDRRLLHHDGNVGRLKPLYEKYGSTAAYAEWLSHECLLIFGSQLSNISTDQLIEEFGLETMRDYLARVRRDRQLALKGLYRPKKQK